MYQVIDANGVPGEPVDINVLRQWASEGKVNSGTMLLDPITGLKAPAGDMLTIQEVFTQPTNDSGASGIPPPLQSATPGFSASVLDHNADSGFSSSPPIESGASSFGSVTPQQPADSGYSANPSPSQSMDYSSPPPAPSLDYSSQPPLQNQAPLTSQPPVQSPVAPIPPPTQSYIPAGGFTPQTYPNAAPLLSRFLGLLIDHLIAIPLVIMSVIPLVGLLGAPLLLAYFLSRDSFFGGQSIGKKVIGERVVRTDGQPFTWKDSAIRNITYAPCILFAIPILGPVIAGPLFGLCGIADVISVLATQKRIGEHLNPTTVVSEVV